MSARGIAATIGSAFAEVRSNRASFLTQVTVMVLNDAAWVVFWAIFFDRVGSVRGWDRDRVLTLLAVFMTGAGAVLALLANARRVGKLAADGELDAALALPIRPLAYVLVRRMDAINFGDVVFGVFLFVVVGDLSPGRVASFVLAVATSFVVLTGFLVTVGSIAFYAGKGEAGDFGLHAVLLFASYPIDIFSGGTKLLLYTALPAAFISGVPASVVDDFDLTRAVAMVGVACFFALAGAVSFRAGLKRYASGSVWTRA
ncbi:MAG TPA: ABC-2 family transporter protein [Acidimicrobiales bacterium]